MAPLLAAVERLADNGGVLTSTGTPLTRAAEIAERHTISVYEAAYAAGARRFRTSPHQLRRADLVSNGFATKAVVAVATVDG
jgi:hypothetical protein